MAARADEGEDLTVIFDDAASYLKHVVGRLESDQLLYFYARFKQAKEGPCNIPKPTFFDFQGKSKWEAWKKLGSMSCTQAMTEYVEELSKIDPEWEAKLESDDEDTLGGVGMSVSTMYKPDDDITDENKTVFDWCKECNIEKVRSLLANQRADVNAKDTEGMGLLHWAADRGFVNMVELLLQHQADPNIQDADDQTPLHYAVCCGHAAVIQTLIRHKASLKIADSEGQLPSDIEVGPDIRQILTDALAT